MTSITVGLVPAPGMPRTLIEKIIDELPELTEKYIDADCIFKFELEVSPLASSAEYINETIHRMAKIKKKMTGIMLSVLPICRVCLKIEWSSPNLIHKNQCRSFPFLHSVFFL